MPTGGAVPEQLFTAVAGTTVLTVMFVLGLGIVLRDFGWVRGHPALVARGLFAVLVGVPALAIVVVRTFDLARPVQIGIVLMAISPGAPIALRRSLAAGGHRAFAPALQVLVAMLAVVSMPLSIAALEVVYAGEANIEPGDLARQVFFAQLLPLTLGMLTRRALPRFAAWIEPKLARIATLLLIAFVILALIDVWRVVVDAGPRVAAAIVVITALALAVGHLLGGPNPQTRTAVAVSSAMRNPGLALLVATLNDAAPEIVRTVLAYLLVSALAVMPYLTWRRRDRMTPTEEAQRQ